MSDHLKLERELFQGAPFAWIQWKGTDACMDMHCECGHMGHVDAMFAYYFECPQCKEVYEVGSHVRLYKLSLEERKALTTQPATSQLYKD